MSGFFQLNNYLYFPNADRHEIVDTLLSFTEIIRILVLNMQSVLCTFLFNNIAQNVVFI